MKKLEMITDEALVAACRKNDREAWGELYNRYYNKVFHKCLSFVKNHDEAFDLAEEALLKAFSHLNGFRGDASFSTWLFTITHRHCLEALRKNNKRLSESHDLEEEIRSQADPEREASFNEGDPKALMLTLIDVLPGNEKQLLLLKYSQGESIEALQEKFNLSQSAIKMRLKRTKEKLNHLYVIATAFGLAEALSQLG